MTELTGRETGPFVICGMVVTMKPLPAWLYILTCAILGGLIGWPFAVMVTGSPPWTIFYFACCAIWGKSSMALGLKMGWIK